MTDPAAGPQGHHRVHRAASTRPGVTRRPARREARASAARSRAQIFLDDVRVPATHVLGEVGDGLQGRDAHARRRPHRHRRAGARHRARRARGRGRATRRSARRSASRSREHQAIQFKLADMATEIDAARLLTLRAALTEGPSGVRHTPRAAMAKLFASEMANRVAHKAHPDPRRQRLHHRVPGRAPLPRRQDHRDLRGHERDPAPRDRAGVLKP